MRVQAINQSSIYQMRNRYDGSAQFSGEYYTKLKPNVSMCNQSMVSFKGQVPIEQGKTLIGEVGSLLKDSCNAIKESFNKSNTKKILVAPIQKKWSDFASRAPKGSQVVKGAFYVTAGAVILDTLTGEVLK